MPPNRSENRSYKLAEKIAFAIKIEHFFYAEEITPCKYCKHNDCRYIVATDKGNRYVEYVRVKRNRCDFSEKLPSIND